MKLSGALWRLTLSKFVWDPEEICGHLLDREQSESVNMQIDVWCFYMCDKNLVVNVWFYSFFRGDFSTEHEDVKLC